MQALQPSFMLLPDSSFSPDMNIQLGRLLMQTNDSLKLPNPRRPFTSVKLEVRSDSSERPQTFEDPWKWNSGNSLDTNASVWADIALITGIGAGVDANRSKNDTLDIECKGVVQQTFYPTAEDLSKLVKDRTISGLLNGADRPSVYLITGLMTAEQASFRIVHTKGKGGGAHVSADLTSVGAPLNVGLDAGRQSASDSTLVAAPRERFILAYQLVRLRRKVFGGIKDSLVQKWALFDDDLLATQAPSLADFEIEQLSPSGIDGD